MLLSERFPTALLVQREWHFKWPNEADPPFDSINLGLAAAYLKLIEFSGDTRVSKAK